MTVDLRRFEYSLEPLRRRRQWQLDALQAELGRAQKALTAAQGRVEALEIQLEQGTQRAAQGLTREVDPPRHGRTLAWLVEVRNRIEHEQQRIATLRAERDRARSECVAMQHKLDVIERHRDECIAEFQQEEEARIASDADRDWLSRRQWSGGTVEGEP